MKKECSLKDIMIEASLELYGSVSMLKKIGNAPIVFLFDENHNNLNDCIEKNIENAKILISNANIVLVGVESLAGGKEWDEETCHYVTDNSNEKYYREVIMNGWTSNCTTFCDEISKSNPQLVFGVESIGMMNKIETDIYTQQPVCQSTAIKSHPLTKERSKHFILTLFNIYVSTKLKGNIILNCGSDHNTHIEEWIINDEIDNIVGIRANYVRINTFN